MFLGAIVGEAALVRGSSESLLGPLIILVQSCWTRG